MSAIEESFAPEPFDEDDSISLPPLKRICVAGTPAERQKRKRELVKDNLKQIIEINWVDDSDCCHHDDDNDDDNNNSDSDSDDQSVCSTVQQSKLEERIHYLKLTLSNAELQIIELEEAQEQLKKNTDALNSFSAAVDIIQTNINEYSNLITLVKSTPFAELIRMESQRVKMRSSLNLDPLSGYIQEVLLQHYERIQEDETRIRDQFHNYLIFEKSKANTILFLKFASAFFLLFILSIVTIWFVL
jgi:hypothetical protein